MQSDLLDPVAWFKGPEGEPRLFRALCEQEIIKDDEELAREFQKVIDLKSFKAGDEIIKQDAQDSDLWLILTGSVNIVVNGHQFSTREAGTHVGEMALLDVTEKRCASVYAFEQLVAGRIAEADFQKIADKPKYWKVWKNIARKLVSRLRQANSRLQWPNYPPQMFIGSSDEDVTIADEFRRALAGNGMVVEIWKSNDVFPPTCESLEKLIRKANSSDFALFILGENDHVTSRKRKYTAPRDNVIFELGLFMGVIGRERTFIAAPRDSKLKLPTDIRDVKRIEFDNENMATLSNQVKRCCDDTIIKIIQDRGPRKIYLT